MTVSTIPGRTLDAGTERLFRPELLADPYPAYARVRDEGRVYFSPARHHPLLVHHAEVEAVLRDPRWSARRVPAVMAMRSQAMRDEMCPYAAVASRQLLFADPPDHTRLRGLVSHVFTPRAVENMRPRVETIVDKLLDQVATRGTMDVIADLASPLPVTVILEMLGLPSVARHRFRTWSADFAGILGNALLDEKVDRRGLHSVVAAVEYLSQRRDFYGSGLEEGVLSALLAEGERADRLDLNELVANTLFLVTAGHETTTNLIGLPPSGRCAEWCSSRRWCPAQGERMGTSSKKSLISTPATHLKAALTPMPPEPLAGILRPPRGSSTPTVPRTPRPGRQSSSAVSSGRSATKSLRSRHGRTCR